MYSLNRVELLGNLTTDPEVKSFASGQSVTNFSIATNRRWKDKDGNMKEDTQYHEVTVWGKQGELASQMLKKGKKVYVEGRLTTDSWEGNDGVKRFKTKVVVENFIPCFPREGGASTESFGEAAFKPAPKTETKNKSEDTAEEINLDDIPF